MIWKLSEPQSFLLGPQRVAHSLHTQWVATQVLGQLIGREDVSRADSVKLALTKDSHTQGLASV
jgi:hypothetical protein